MELPPSSHNTTTLHSEEVQTDLKPPLILPNFTRALAPQNNLDQVANVSGLGRTTTEELESRMKRTEEINPNSAIENFGNSENTAKVSNEGKEQCPRCEKWFFPDDLSSHMTSHSSQILDWLYLGGYRNSSNLKELTDRTQIGSILNVSAECENSFPDKFNYKKLSLFDTDDQNIIEKFDEAIEFIDEAQRNAKKVLVHCIQGSSRSAAFIIAYLMAKKDMTLKDAYEHVYHKRNIVKPNRGFISQLMEYELKTKGVVTFTYSDMYPTGRTLHSIKEELRKKKDHILEKIEKHLTHK